LTFFKISVMRHVRPSWHKFFFIFFIFWKKCRATRAVD